jgi:hypothetical protein
LKPIYSIRSSSGAVVVYQEKATAVLREAGRDHPDMKKIEALLEAIPPPEERK